MAIRWSLYLSSSPETPSPALSQFLWYNNYIKIKDTVNHFENSLMIISTSYHSYLKMAGSYYWSISKMNMN